MTEKYKEVQQIPTLTHGDMLRIRRGELAGWTATIEKCPQMCGQVAAFSSVDDLLEWLGMTLQASARDPS